MSLVENKVIDISLNTPKKRFRINGDNNRILELNTSDITIVKRLKDIYPKLQELANDAIKKVDGVKDETSETGERSIDLDQLADVLSEIDGNMRTLVDELFDANVSEVCAPDGSMYDPFNGVLRYEHIIETLANLYSTNFKDEVKAMNKRVQKHTDKYIKGKK